MMMYLKILSPLSRIKKGCVDKNRQSPGRYCINGLLIQGDACCYFTCFKFLHLIHLAVGLSHDLNWKGGCFYRRLVLKSISEKIATKYSK